MSINHTKIATLENKIGYSFKDKHWLERALTHSSTNDDFNYQRLEFLGDRVLGLIMASALFKEFRNENEGGLAKRHTALVQGQTCALIGQSIALGDYIFFSHSEKQSGGQNNENIIADVMESLLGAIYIDGGYEAVQTVTLKLWGDTIKTVKTAPQDPKTELQEWVQARGLDLPLYEMADRQGPDHAPVFMIALYVEGQKTIKAKGSSRRQAEKSAAQAMLEQIKTS